MTAELVNIKLENHYDMKDFWDYYLILFFIIFKVSRV